MRDEVLELDAIPQSSVGAPLPVVLGDEHHLVLVYLIENVDPGWDGSTIRVVDMDSAEPVARVTFERPYAFTLGPPNDEAFSGHPLASRGLHPYGAFEIRGSSWVDRLRDMNAVHPNHRDEAFASYRHFVFAFHDSTFECVAESYSVAEVDGPMSTVVAELHQQLR